MKKLLALILAAALALSLVACGGGSGAGDTNTPSTGNGDTTSTDTPSGGGDNTKEEMLSTASTCDFSKIQYDYEQNKVNAQETYVGKIYKITGYVSNIESEYISIVPLNTTLIKSSSSPYPVTTVRAYISKDDVKRLSTNDVINIVGEVTNLDSISTIEMKNAYYIDNIVAISGNTHFVWNISHTNQLLEIKSKAETLNTYPETYPTLLDYRYTYTVPSSGDNEKFGETIFDDVIVSEGDTINVECVLKYDETTNDSIINYRYHMNLTINDIITVNKD